MARPSPYPAELRERAVRMAAEVRPELSDRVGCDEGGRGECDARLGGENGAYRGGGNHEQDRTKEDRHHP